MPSLQNAITKCLLKKPSNKPPANLAAGKRQGSVHLGDGDCNGSLKDAEGKVNYLLNKEEGGLVPAVKEEPTSTGSTEQMGLEAVEK